MLTLTACKSSRDAEAALPEQKSGPKPVTTEESARPSPWLVTTSRNAITGEETVVTKTFDGRQALVIRQTGKKLECYVTTGHFLETVENVHSHLSAVIYKFDDGSVVRQAWRMSADYEALFYPGNPLDFLNKIHDAKRFAVQYKPADEVSQTLSFDVSRFPAESWQRLPDAYTY